MDVVMGPGAAGSSSSGSESEESSANGIGDDEESIFIKILLA